MDFLLHNFIADMEGPSFLGFYAVVIVLVFTLCLLLGRSLPDRSKGLPLPAIPKQPDPYEFACLYDLSRPPYGQWNRLVQTVTFRLVQLGYLRIEDGEMGKQIIIQTAPPPDVDRLLPIERAVYNYFFLARDARSVLASKIYPLKPEIQFYANEYQTSFLAQDLLLQPESHKIVHYIWLLGMLIVAGLGGYKLTVANIKGYSNVGFLIAMGIVALIAFTIAYVYQIHNSSLRLNGRGNAYLSRLQSVFKSPESRPGRDPLPLTDPMYALVVALSGMWILRNTPLEDFYQASLMPSSASASYSSTSSHYGSDSGSSSCSSGSSSCSSGSSGCGGCGSS